MDKTFGSDPAVLPRRFRAHLLKQFRDKGFVDGIQGGRRSQTGHVELTRSHHQDPGAPEPLS